MSLVHGPSLFLVLFISYSCYVLVDSCSLFSSQVLGKFYFKKMVAVDLEYVWFVGGIAWPIDDRSRCF